MNDSPAGKPDKDESKKFNEQGVRPKVKSYLCIKTAEVGRPCANSQNGNISTNDEFNGIQNGASSSVSEPLNSSLLASSPSFCLNQLSLCKQSRDCSGEKCSAKGRAFSSEENDLRNDKKRKTNCFIDSESSSGNDGEEGLSSDDCYIYTYKGDQFADLPNSFLSVDAAVCSGNESLRESHRKANHRKGAEDQDRNNLGSSPEMDFLEMDFDPGPSLEQDSEEDLNGFERKASYSSLVELPLLPKNKTDEENAPTIKTDTSDNSEQFQPGPSYKNLYQCPPNSQAKVSDCNSNTFNRTKGFFGSCCGSFNTLESSSANCNVINENVKEELKSKENSAVSKTCSILLAEKLDTDRVSTESNDIGTLDDRNKISDKKSLCDGIMLWSEQEAISKQMTFMSSDLSCAATAVINAMLVLKMRISIEEVKQGISTRLKSKSTSIPEYLVSRSHAGFAHENIIRGIHYASHGLLFARFFQMYPRRDIVLTNWLNHWMKKGAVPIVTMNVQRNSASEDSKLDIRHHQMIFGVNNKGIYLTNPLECLQEEELWSRFVSSSVLKIKRSDIVSRWSPDSNLKPLMFQNDERWKEMNVLGQVVNVIREFSDAGEHRKFLTQHIFIPASSGITLVIHKYSPSYHELVSVEDLPLISDSASKK